MSAECPKPPANRQGVVAVVPRGDRLLVIRRSSTVVAPRAFCFPGGGIHAHETEAEAIVRELQEELGVNLRPVRRLWRSVTPWQVELAWWLGEIASDAQLSANPAEVESFHWHTPAEIAALEGLLESNRHFLAAMAAGQIVLD